MTPSVPSAVRPDRPIAVSATAVLVVVSLVAVVFVASGPVAAQSSAATVTNATVVSGSPTAGDTFVVSATIRNADSATAPLDLTNVYVSGPDGRSQVARNLGELAPGTETTVRLQVTVSEPGSHTLTLRVVGRDESSPVVSFEHPIPVRVSDAQSSEIAMAATADDLGPSGRTDLHVTVANGFDRAITGVNLRVDSDELTLPEPQRVASQLPPGNQTRFSFPVRDVDPGAYALTATLEYSADGERRTIQRDLSAVVSAVNEPGTIRLTGVEIVPEDGQLSVRGSASNVGTTDVSSVEVSVGTGETAEPADSSATYFVGNVPASDFSSFDVRAQPTGNGTITIPLEVSYVVDGVRTTQTVDISHRLDSSGSSGQPGSGGNGGGGGNTGLIVVVGLLLVVGAGVVGWRRYGG